MTKEELAVIRSILDCLYLLARQANNYSDPLADNLMKAEEKFARLQTKRERRKGK